MVFCRDLDFEEFLGVAVLGVYVVVWCLLLNSLSLTFVVDSLWLGFLGFGMVGFLVVLLLISLGFG